jgi:hypothetical protein
MSELNKFKNVLTVDMLTGAAHGEITIYPMGSLMHKFDEIPEDAQEMETDEYGRYVVAHSESGHNHVLRSFETGNLKCFMMRDDPMHIFMEVGGEAAMEHLKTSADSHGSFGVAPGVYVGKISREGIANSPGAWRKAQD